MHTHSFSQQEFSSPEVAVQGRQNLDLNEGINNRENYDFQRLSAASLQNSGDRLMREQLLPRVELIEGATIHRDRDGRIDAIASDNGANRNFRYDANGQLQAVNYRMPNGHQGYLTRTAEGWRQSVETSHGIRRAMLQDVDVDQQTGEVKLTMGDGRGTRYWRPDNTMADSPQISQHDRTIRPRSTAGEDGAERLVPAGEQDLSTEQTAEQASAETQQQAQADEQDYSVQAGDSLWAIASRELSEGGEHPSPRQIMNEINRLAKLNNIANPNKIQVGQKIKLH